MTGAVLAGGQGRRMGSDKALLPWAGQLAWQRQKAVLSAAGAAPVAVVRRADQSALGDICWRDRRTDCGPLAGLEAALEEAQSAEHLAVLAVDMPGIDAAWFEWLRGQCQGGSGAVGVHAEAAEPLAAIYPTGILAEVSTRLDRRELALQGLVRRLAAAGRVTLVEIPRGRLAAVRSRNYPTA